MRSKEEIRGLVEGFAKSGMKRREYCAKHGVGISTLDYWRRRYRKQKPRLVPVAIQEERHVLADFALVLTNGRRIESSWSFLEADLEKLIRVAEG
jgi:transposase-like protein